MELKILKKKNIKLNFKFNGFKSYKTKGNLFFPLYNGSGCINKYINEELNPYLKSFSNSNIELVLDDNEIIYYDPEYSYVEKKSLKDGILSITLLKDHKIELFADLKERLIEINYNLSLG